MTPACAGAAALVVSPSCKGVDFAPRTLVQTLRIINDRADPPYAAPGQQVTLRMRTNVSLNNLPCPVIAHSVDDQHFHAVHGVFVCQN